MPDSGGKLTKQEMHEVLAWLSKKWNKPRSCPLCDQKKWIVGEYVIYAPQAIQRRKSVFRDLALSDLYAPDKPFPATSSARYPHVLVICDTCGYTFHMNAVIIGIVQAGPDGEADG